MRELSEIIDNNSIIFEHRIKEHNSNPDIS
jgi:hypothetical protein